MSRERKEDLASSIIHAVGIVLAIAGTVILVFLSAATRDNWRIVSSCVYGATLILLFTASTLYHAFEEPGIKRRLRILDHSSIYLLIAGTYTPFVLGALRGSWGWPLFGVVWFLALAGLIFKFLAIDRFHVVSTIVYVFMGWLVVIAIKPILALFPLITIILLVAGGLFYTVGVFFYMSDRRVPYNHLIWHVFVLVASACHYFAVAYSVV